MSRVNSMLLSTIITCGLLGTVIARPVVMASITSDWKGSDWKQWNEVRKSYYVWGFRDGQNAAGSALFTDLKVTKNSDLWQHASRKLGVAASVEQIVSGIDSVYSDYRNGNLPLWEVCKYVTESIGGYAHESDLELLRSVYNKGD